MNTIEEFETGLSAEPCPFCGSQNVGTYEIDRRHFPREKNAVTVYALARCKSCGASSAIVRERIYNVMCGLSDQEKEHNEFMRRLAGISALNYWNRRTLQTNNKE